MKIQKGLTLWNLNATHLRKSTKLKNRLPGNPGLKLIMDFTTGFGLCRTPVHADHTAVQPVNWFSRILESPSRTMPSASYDITTFLFVIPEEIVLIRERSIALECVNVNSAILKCRGSVTEHGVSPKNCRCRIRLLCYPKANSQNIVPFILKPEQVPKERNNRLFRVFLFRNMPPKKAKTIHYVYSHTGQYPKESGKTVHSVYPYSGIRPKKNAITV